MRDAPDVPRAPDRLLDDGLVFPGPDGRVVGGTDDLAAHREGRLRLTRLEPSDERVQPLGDVAAVAPGA